MTEDQIHRIFGDGPAGDIAAWVIAAAIFLGLIFAAAAWAWKRMRAFVKAAELFGGLPDRFDKIDQTLQTITDKTDEHGAKIDTQAVVLERVRSQVENDHSTNMREEQDERHQVLVEKVDAIAEKTDTAAMEIRGMKRDIGRQADRDERIETKLDRHLEWSHTWSAEREQADRDADERLDQLEQTIDPDKDR